MMLWPNKLKTLGVLLAAGASRRFGPEDKLLALLRGEALVLHAARKLARAGCDGLAAIVSSREVAALLPSEFAVIFIEPGQPMSASFHRAIDLGQERNSARLLLCLGDMPDVPQDILQSLARANMSSACHLGPAVMPPILLTAADFSAARQSAERDRGARAFLARLPAERLFELQPCQARDIDYPADLRPEAAPSDSENRG